MKLHENWIDISYPVHPNLTPTWPSARKVEFIKKKDMCCGDAVNDTDLHFNLHTGTHIDAPLHFLENGKSIDQMPLSQFLGECFVVDIGESKEIRPEHFESAKIPKDIKRILTKTKNSFNWTPDFNKEFIGLTLDAAKWMADRKIVLYGNDYLSVQPYKGNNEIHKVLLNAETVLIEGLYMPSVMQGLYELICLPMFLKDVEAAPARVLIRRI